MGTEKIEFELIENGIITKYKYFGRTRSMGGMDLGIDVNYPKILDKKTWYENLNKEKECMAAATISYLIHVGSDLNFIGDYAFSQLTAFTEKYLPDAYFSEPYFIDGDFGRFSDYGELGYPDNYEEENNEVLFWNKEKIEIKLLTGIDCFDDLRNKIFIDVSIEDEFKSELKALIELFNPDSKV